MKFGKLLKRQGLPAYAEFYLDYKKVGLFLHAVHVRRTVSALLFLVSKIANCEDSRGGLAAAARLVLMCFVHALVRS